MNKKVIAGILVVIAVVAIGFWVWDIIIKNN